MIQFSIAIILVIASVVMIRQTRLLTSLKDGLSADEVLVLPYRAQVHASYDQIQQELARDESVFGVFLCSSRPGDVLPLLSYRVPGAQDHIIPTLFVSPGFFTAMPVELVEGALPDAESVSFVVNRAAYDMLGRPELGRKKIQYVADSFAEGVVSGVIQDLPFHGGGGGAGPVIFWTNPVKFLHVLVRIDPGRSEQAFEHLRQAWAELHFGEQPVFEFLSDRLRTRYAREGQMELAVRGFAVVSVFLSAFGLFSIALVQVHRKRVQTGIRRVLGASGWQLVWGLFREYALLLAVANLVAWPLGWYIMDAWLSTFADRVSIMPGIFGIAGFVSVLTAATAVLFQIVGVVRSKPVEVLRYE